MFVVYSWRFELNETMDDYMLIRMYVLPICKIYFLVLWNVVVRKSSGEKPIEI